jgi:acetoin utilization deacetylase AcuC-like enzyme
MRVFYAARYRMDIGPHVFPTEKYGLVVTRLLDAGIIQPSQIIEPDIASWDDLALVHTADYLASLREGTIDVAQLELPWSREMVDAFRLMVGGTIQAARVASGLNEFPIPDCKLSIHVGGGLHHAFPNHGEGFCPFNDVAVAVRDLQSRGLERAAIIDLDVHHGNGTAFVFESDPQVFTFSMHQQHNYPMWKPKGSLDIGLPDEAGDSRFLRELEQSLPLVMASNPQCVFYLAGADPYEDDQLGGLRLTRDGLRQRDRMVIEAAREVPLVITLAGGYARHIDETVAIHVATIEEAKSAATWHRS